MGNPRKKILITGGMGFIGSQLARKSLSQGYEVTLLSRSESKASNIADIRQNLNIVLKDIKEISQEVADKEFIFHLAGTVDNYALTNGEPYRDVEINCNGTIALLEAVKKYNPLAKIILASTFFVNGDPKSLPVGPDAPCNPKGMYGATRLAAEHFCHVYHNVFDLKPIIARFTNIFGPYESSHNKKKAVFNRMIGQALRGEEIKLYNGGDFIRDYIYVDDVVDACLTLAEKGEIDKIYYVARGEFVKFKTLVDVIAREIPDAKITSITPPEFHNRAGVSDFVADVSDLKKLGWSPKVSLEEGIKRTIEYCRKNPSF